MKTIKKVIFKIHGVEVESVNGDEIDLNELENLKITIAFAHSVGTQDIEVMTQDIVVREFATNLHIGTEGLFFKTKNDYSVFRVVDTIKPTVNINTNDGFQKFLDMIFEKDIENALTFE